MQGWHRWVLLEWVLLGFSRKKPSWLKCLKWVFLGFSIIVVRVRDLGLGDRG